MVGTLPRLGPDHDEGYPRYQRYSAEDWRKREGVLSLVRDLQRACIDHLFLVSKRESARCVTDDAKDNEKNSDNGCRLHGFEPFFFQH